MEHDAHRDAHVHGLRLALGSILAPKRPSPPSHTGSYPGSGTASPFHHWHHPGSGGSGSEHDSPPLPSPQPHSSPVMPHYHPHYPQSPNQHAHHQPTPTNHPHLNAHPQFHSHVHAHPQPQSHAHAHTYGPSRLIFTHSTSSTPPESLSPSPSPSPRLATPPPMLDHAPHAYPHEAAVGDSGVTKTATAANPDAAADQKRAHFIKTLQSKSAWDALIHGSWV
ncbi:hypothetical protein BGY98DRAFT_957094 [Russula aff. rugulosa BPL654]|nr:hypothetical protein BGY98DRAFT_957094 [Russula aff. rugulosa BPL654]